MNGQRCPGCPHPPHAGQCFAKTEPVPGRLVQCRCKEKARGVPVHSDHAALPGIAGLSAVQDLAQQKLTAIREDLDGICVDLLGQIGAIGQTMTDGAARLLRISEEEYADATMRSEGARDTLPRWTP